jgi:hypothetical protein
LVGQVDGWASTGPDVSRAEPRTKVAAAASSVRDLLNIDVSVFIVASRVARVIAVAMSRI